MRAAINFGSKVKGQRSNVKVKYVHFYSTYETDEYTLSSNAALKSDQ